MTPPEDTRAAAIKAEATAALLTMGHKIDLWSLTLTALALATLCWATLPGYWAALCLCATVVAGAIQKGHAVRVAFDAAIFQRWATAWRTADETNAPENAVHATLSCFDRWRGELGLPTSPMATPRNLAERSQGAQQLLRRQAYALIAQLAAFLAAGVLTGLSISR